MKAIKCELCGSNEFVKEDEFFVCQYCHTKYTTEDAKKMMVEIEGKVDVSGSTVKVDSSDELKKLFEVARRAKDDGNTENAEKFYNQILVKSPNSWEANFYSTYFQCMNCKIGEIGISASKIINCEETIFSLIKENEKDEEKQKQAVEEVANKLVEISGMFFRGYKNHYDNIGIEIKSRYIQEYATTCSLARDVVYTAGNLIDKIFEGKYKESSVICWKLGVQQHNILNGVFDNKGLNADIINSYNEKIKKYDSSYVPPVTNMKPDGACYVATCVYGSYDCPKVWTLRRFRDYYLDKSIIGKAFIKTYYFISPKVIRVFGSNKHFKSFNKSILDRLIVHLKSKGYEDTPYDDKY